MRFYFGFSKKINLKKLVLISTLALLAFLGLTKVRAESVDFYEISTDTFESVDDCNYSYATTEIFLGGNLSFPSYITYNNLYSDSIVLDDTDSSIKFKQSSNNSAYIDIKYHISTDIENLYLTSKFFYVSYSSTSDRPEGANWYYCTDNTFSTCTLTNLSSLGQNNVYNANYYKNQSLGLTWNNTRYEYFILRLRGSHYGTSTNDIYKWQYITLSNSQIDTTNDSTISSASSNYCTLASNDSPVLDESTQAIIDSIEQGLSQDTIDNANDFFGGNLSEVDPNNPLPPLNDTHGLYNIITAPISLLRGIINSNTSCDSTLNLSFNIPNLTGGSNYNKTVSIPNGCILWNNVPNVALVAYQVIVFGLWGYFILVDLVHLVDNLLDPDNKDIFILDL